jgi:hypothetical protein
MKWSIAGRTAATAATANQVGAQLWHPAGSTRSLRVMAVSWYQNTAGPSVVAVDRSSARGNAATSLTPVVTNDWAGNTAPPSAAVLDLAAFSQQPTLVPGTELFRASLANAAGSGFNHPFPGGITIPAGTGLCIYTPVGTILQPADVTFYVVEE